MSSTTTQPTYLFTETQDWFSFNTDTWRNLFRLITDPEPRVLEIGSWEGRSAVFLLTELCTDSGELVCIDHFDLMNTEAGRERHRKLTHNLSLTGKPFRVLPAFSFPALLTLLVEEMSAAAPGFDWVYVDGSHEADDTFLDGELAWRLARKGAIVVFDDYHWNREPEDSIHHPKRGIDAFLALHAGEYTRLSSEGQYQYIIQKSTDMRIGFLVSDQAGSKEGLDAALGHGINVALTIDAEYAMAAAVAIYSAAMYTRSRTTFYVLGRDLSDDVKTKLREAISHNPNSTMLFIDLLSSGTIHPNAAAEGSLPDGPIWDKIMMIHLLPVERVLYLDADILVRGDLKELWDTALRGNALAAVPDVGFPKGHDGLAPYFNAGVMLMDLAVIRHDLTELCATSVKLNDSKFKDQDALNTHFRGKWLPISLRWNAQGLGTYVKYHTQERAALPLQDMDNPSIVHFTGPVHPKFVDVLNPFVQPFTAKPWGYMGAPGHPFAEEWWAICEKTAWRGWRSSIEYGEQRAEKIEEAIATGVKEFREKATLK